MGGLDKRDAEILRMMQENSRYTVKEIANRINLSPSPTFDRQKRLERDGYIKNYATVVDWKKVGNGLIALCNVHLKEQKGECGMQFIEAISKIDEVTECYNISGDYDFLLKIYLRDMAHYQDFIFNKLGKIESAGSFHSEFVIAEVKNSHSVPVYDETDK